MRLTHVGMPHWLLMILFMLLPAWAGVRRIRAWLRRRRQERLGLCANCGYDLRATPDRCPECGMVVSKEGAAVVA
jgi:predicted amidophosphoribosyltransferase